MSFFRHLGTKASKFQFQIRIDDVIGVYPSTYSTAAHSTEGIYVILKRKNKSYRTKIALPEDGGAVRMNDCIKFTSTLYQKKRKNGDDGQLAMLPKPFTLRVSDATHGSIRWQTHIDLSDYASVFGVDTHESFILQFANKSNRAKDRHSATSMQNIPFEITVRIRVTSEWLRHIDSMSQASTGSSVSMSMTSRISSSAMSELSSDIDGYTLYNSTSMFQHDARNSMLFSTLPEEHSIHNSPEKHRERSFYDSTLPLSFVNNNGNGVPPPPTLIPTPPPPPPPQPRSSLDSFTKQKSISSTKSKSADFHIRINSASGSACEELSRPATEEFTCPAETRIPNLSFLMSPENKKRKKMAAKNLTSPIVNAKLLCSPDQIMPTTMATSSFLKFDAANNSGLFMESELIRIDNAMENLSMMSLVNPNERSMITESMMTWQEKTDGNADGNVELVDRDADADLQSVESVNSSEKQAIHGAIDFVLAQCVTDVDFSSAELIWNNAFPMHCAVIFRCLVHWRVFDENLYDTQLMLQRYVTAVSTASENHPHDDLAQSYWLLRVTTLSHWMHLHFADALRVRGDDTTDTCSLHLWFAQKLTSLARFCFGNMLDHLLFKLSRIPYEQVFDGTEFGEQGSNTMDMIFAALNGIWFLWRDLALYHAFRAQMCRQSLHYVVIRLLNQLLAAPEFCTVAGGFRLKVIRSMVLDWCQSNGINACEEHKEWFATLVLSLEHVSALLLTCAVVEDGRELLTQCPSLTAAQINQLLNNYNQEPSNEPLSAEVLAPILEVAAAEASPRAMGRVSVHDITFHKKPMREFDLNLCPMPRVALNDVPIPFEVTPGFEFLSIGQDEHTDDLVL